MERTLTPDERIKRAEEIYYRKKIQASNRNSARVNVSEEKDFGMLKKMLLQLLICAVIYSIFYMIKNTNYVFSDDVIKKTNEILSYDLNIKKLYEQVMLYLNKFTNNVGAAISRPQDDNNSNSNNSESSINTNTESLNSESTNESLSENIGGENVALSENETRDLTQMEQDAKDILASKSLIIPLKGTITSRYGLRNPETPTVPKNHTGIDIAVNEGTVFIASMAGTVEKVSSERRFR